MTSLRQKIALKAVVVHRSVGTAPDTQAVVFVRMPCCAPHLPLCLHCPVSVNTNWTMAVSG
jgi:hypothetical protein